MGISFYVLILRLFLKELGCLLHIFPDGNGEGTASFADAALNAIGSIVGKSGVVFADGFGNVLLCLGEVEKFGDGGDVNALGTGGTVPAVHAVSQPADFWEGLKN